MFEFPLSLYLNHAVLYVALATAFLLALVLFIFPVFATFIFQAQTGDTSFSSLWLYAFGIAFAFNLWDWLVLDWLVFCTMTPGQFVIPGSGRHPAYKDYFFHFRGFLIGTVFCAVMALIAGGIVTLY